MGSLSKSSAFIGIAFMISCYYGCDKSKQESTANQIIGRDNRIDTEDSMITAQLGVIESPSSYCQAYISGEFEVSTAAHCIKEDPKNLSQFRFRDYKGKSSRITALAALDLSKDLISFKIDGNLSRPLLFGKITTNQTLMIVARNSSNTGFLVSQCAIDRLLDKNAAVAYRCDTEPGYSGVPLIQGKKIVGMHLGYSKGLKLNVGLNDSLSPFPDLDIRGIADLQPECRCSWRCPGSCVKDVVNPLDEFRKQAEKKVGDFAMEATNSYLASAEGKDAGFEGCVIGSRAICIGIARKNLKNICDVELGREVCDSLCEIGSNTACAAALSQKKTDSNEGHTAEGNN